MRILIIKLMLRWCLIKPTVVQTNHTDLIATNCRKKQMEALKDMIIFG